MTEFTTMEKLQMKVGPSGAVLKYGEKVLVTCETYYGFTAEVYEFVETPEETGLGYIECRLSLIEKAEKHFEDGGPAIAWCNSQQGLGGKNNE